MVHIKKKNLFLFLFWLYFALQYCVGFAIHVHLWLIHVNVWQKKIFKKKEKKIQIVVVVLLVSHVWLFATPWTVACQASMPMGLSRQEYRSGLPFPPPGVFLTQGSNSRLLHWQADSSPLSYLWSPHLERVSLPELRSHLLVVQPEAQYWASVFLSLKQG